MLPLSAPLLRTVPRSRSFDQQRETGTTLAELLGEGFVSDRCQDESLTRLCGAASCATTTPAAMPGPQSRKVRRPLTTLQCCSQLPLLLDRRRACSANDHSHAPAHSRGDGNRNSFIAPPRAATALSRRGPRPAVTTATSQPITRGSQIPIAPARRTVPPLPARGFLLRGFIRRLPSQRAAMPSDGQASDNP